MSGRKILIVDRNSLRRQLLAFGLRCAGFSLDEAESEQSAYAQVVRACPHLVLISAEELDPAVRELVRIVRVNPVTLALPVMVLAERASQLDVDTALACGIDDLLLLPVGPEDFVARARALTRTSVQALSSDRLAGLQIDDAQRTIRREDRCVPLAPTELGLLHLLLRHAGEVLSRDLLQFRVWGGAGRVETRVVDVSVCRLRRSLEQLGYEGVVQTVRGKGYRLVQVTMPGASLQSAAARRRTG